MITAETIIMFLKSIPALLLVFLIWPLGLGAGLGIKKNIDRYIIGFAAVQAVFFLCYIPAILNAWSSRTLTAVGAITISALAIGGAAIRFVKASEKKDFLALRKPDFKYLKNPFFLGALIIILYELYVYVFKEPWIYGDDVTYIRMVTDFVDTNAIYTKTWSGQADLTPLSEINYKYVFTSYYPFLGSISILTGLHPLILCKTVIPVFYLPIHYLITWRIGMFLFGDEKDGVKMIEMKSLFMFFYAILIEFGHISYYTMSRRVTLWIYNSKSDCFTILLPALFIYTFIFLTEKAETNNILTNTGLIYRQFLIFVMALSSISATTMGLIMSPIVMGTWFIIAAFRLKKPSLFFSSLWTFVPHLMIIILIVRFVRLN
ncbi:MAG: hypothetical protein K6F79_00285 [Saccharofermentans sp.]|nr:hypothetical protein [Saccharofermentans sp.]